MKKLVCVISIIVSIASALVCFSACNSKSETARVELTIENYADYIAVNVYYSDCVAELAASTNATYNYYDLSCIGNIVTSKRVNAVFENVSIEFYAVVFGWSVSSMDKPTAQLDYGAVSHCSFPISRSGATKIYYPYSQKTTIRVTSIEGFVVIG